MDNLLGEFMGTMVLVVFGCGVCANMTLTNSKGQNGGWVCITLGWGFAVTLGVFTATTLGAPQGDLNPAVTLAKTMVGIYTGKRLQTPPQNSASSRRVPPFAAPSPTSCAK